jgi:hypothetical protein
MLPAKKRERSKNITLMLPVERTLAGSDFKSELELLDVLMTYEQESYRPALDQIGYTAEVMEQLQKELDPRAKAIHDFLRNEYAAGWFDMNRVFQRVFKMDMPQIRNYAPGTFENVKIDNGKEAAGSLLGSTGATSAMGAGATKNRRAHAARPLTLSALSKYWAHTEQTAYWMEWTELIGEIARTLRSPDVRRAIEARHGLQVARVVRRQPAARCGETRVIQAAQPFHAVGAVRSRVGGPGDRLRRRRAIEHDVLLTADRPSASRLEPSA